MIRIQHILCPIDFSEASAAALRYAVEFAQVMNAKITFLHVVQPQPITADINVAFVPVELDLEKHAEEDLSTMIQADVPTTIVTEKKVMIAQPTDAIVNMACESDVDFIIMGSHGKKGLERFLLGSTAEAVTRRAPCPVLIVKTHEKEFICKE
jgi:universal stress protein A